MVVCGPGIAPGSRCDEPVAGWDLLPTLVDLAGGRGVDLPADLDGGSQPGERNCTRWRTPLYLAGFSNARR